MSRLAGRCLHKAVAVVRVLIEAGRSRNSASRMPKPLRQGSKSTFPPKYLAVGETARILGVSPSTLRLWDNEGLISPARSGRRYRLYNHEVLGVLKRIRFLRDVQKL